MQNNGSCLLPRISIFFYRSQFVFLMCGLAYNHQENDLAFLKNQEKRCVSHLSNYLDFQLGLKVGHNTVFENRRKSRNQHCERSELRLHFEWTKID